jgi:DNA integrity scanning protein DisA with diadenylate cyclase activity
MHTASASQIVNSLQRMTVVSILDILLVAAVLYQFLMIVKGRRAANILLGLLILGVVYEVSTLLGLELLSNLLARVAPYLPYVFIVVFQS